MSELAPSQAFSFDLLKWVTRISEEKESRDSSTKCLIYFSGHILPPNSSSERRRLTYWGRNVLALYHRDRLEDTLTECHVIGVSVRPRTDPQNEFQPCVRAMRDDSVIRGIGRIVTFDYLSNRREGTNAYEKTRIKILNGTRGCEKIREQRIHNLSRAFLWFYIKRKQNLI